MGLQCSLWACEKVVTVYVCVFVLYQIFFRQGVKPAELSYGGILFTTAWSTLSTFVPSLAEI